MDAAHDTRRHLGQILVEEGFISAEALTGALDHQALTQRPLGEVVVELGLVSPGAVANALAEQHGGLLRTEYGVSVGLHSREPEPEESEPESEPDPFAPWREALAERDRLLVELSAAVRTRDEQIGAQKTQLEAAWADLQEARDRPADGAAGEQLEEVRARLNDAASAADERAHELAEARAKLVPLKTDLEARTKQLEELSARLQEAQDAAAAAAARAEQAEAAAKELVQVKAKLAEATARLDVAVAEAGARAAQADAAELELAAARGRIEELEAAAVEPEPEVETEHVLLVPAAEGYELVERDGSPPGRGTSLELDAEYVVVRHGPSPLPGGARTCAFLERV